MSFVRSKRFWIAVVLVSLAAAIVVVGVCRRRPASAAAEGEAVQQAVAVEVAPVTVTAIDTTVTAQGNLTAAQGATFQAASPIAGRITEVRVREGDSVSTGQVLAVIDSRSLEAEARSAEAALAASQAEAEAADIDVEAATTAHTHALRAAQLALDAARVDRDQTVKQAQIALDTAQTELSKLQAGARPQEVAQADQTIAEDQATRDRAATELERVRYLFEHGIASKRELEDAETALKVDDAALESARQQADLVRAGPRPEEVRAAKLAVDNAQQGLSQAQASGDAHVAEAQAALQQIEQTGPLEAASKRRDAAALHETTREKKADVQAARVVASSTVVRASLSGVVTRRLLNPGDVADAGAPVVEVTDTHAVNLLANLPAEDGVKIRVGMRAHVTIADVPGHTFHGQVLSVGQVDPQTNLISIRIAVPDPGSSAKLGTFATASVIIGSNAGAIVVPKSAVVTREGKPAVFIVGPDNVARQRAVDVAGEHGHLVEVAHGVTPGEQVILLGQYELADGAPVQPSLARKSGQP